MKFTLLVIICLINILYCFIQVETLKPKDKVIIKSCPKSPQESTIDPCFATNYYNYPIVMINATNLQSRAIITFDLHSLSCNARMNRDHVFFDVVLFGNVENGDLFKSYQHTSQSDFNPKTITYQSSYLYPNPVFYGNYNQQLGPSGSIRFNVTDAIYNDCSIIGFITSPIGFNNISYVIENALLNVFYESNVECSKDGFDLCYNQGLDCCKNDASSLEQCYNATIHTCVKNLVTGKYVLCPSSYAHVCWTRYGYSCFKPEDYTCSTRTCNEFQVFCPSNFPKVCGLETCYNEENYSCINGQLIQNATLSQ